MRDETSADAFRVTAMRTRYFILNREKVDGMYKILNHTLCEQLCAVAGLLLTM